MRLGRGDSLLLSLLLLWAVLVWGWETRHAKAHAAKRVSSFAFVKHVRKQIRTVNRQLGRGNSDIRVSWGKPGAFLQENPQQIATVLLFTAFIH